MYYDIILFFLGTGFGASLMKMIVNYKDKHVHREKAKTEHYRAQYERARVSLACYKSMPNSPVATANNDIEAAPLPLDVFTETDEEALRQGKRVVHIKRGASV